MSEARYDESTRTLRLTTDVGDESAIGRDTWFRIQNVPDPQQCKITCDGQQFANWWTLPSGEIQIATDINVHAFAVTTGESPPVATWL